MDVEITREKNGYTIESRVRTTARTGVEMEALTAVAVAALTIYDMLKALDKTMVIGEICVMEKRGGRSGEYLSEPKVVSRQALVSSPTVDDRVSTTDSRLRILDCRLSTTRLSTADCRLSTVGGGSM